MPLREFSCDVCRHRFEELVSEGERIVCPACGSALLTRRFSAFAVATSGGRTEAGPEGGCGSCGDPRGPGACRID
jgi:putative FmdB family regulatory protein